MSEPSSFALDAATTLLERDPVAPRMAELLAGAYARLGRIASEASILTAELKVARGARLDHARRRLADLDIFASSTTPKARSNC